MGSLIKKLLTENLNLNQYKQWVSTNKQIVKIDSIRNLTKIPSEDALQVNDPAKQAEIAKKKAERGEIINFINNEINQNECFINAEKAFNFFNNKGYDTKFVLGLMLENGNIFGHAWNIINGVHYDLSEEKSEQIKHQHYALVVLDNLNEIRSLDVFDPEGKCEHVITIDNQDYDKNGLCSVYPYYLKNIL